MVKKSSITTVVISGIALFSDGYTAQIVGYMTLLFTDLYKGTMSNTIKTRLSNSFLVGEIFGMLFFGMLIDRVGRRTGVVFATIFLVLGIIISTAAHGTTQEGLFWMMIIGRGMAGFGAGGEYPTCATGATEAADESKVVRKHRGFLVSLSTLFAIDMGVVVAGAVAIVVLLCYGKKAHEGVWRICFGLGAILPLAVFIYRFRMINSTQYRKHAVKKNVPYMLAIKMYWKPILGTTLAWFCYDCIRYPFGLFSSVIVKEFNPTNTTLQNIGYGTLINLFYLPGTLLGGYLMDVIGRKQTMTLGFTCLGIMGFIIGAALPQIRKIFPLFVVLYGIFNASGEMGPGVATFLCGTESFPTPLRGHFMGLAAAMGKVGAVVGTEMFTPILHSFSSPKEGQRAVFLIGSGFALIGSVLSWFLLPDMEKSLETEDERFRKVLIERGYSIDAFGEGLERTMRGSVYDGEVQS
ncbi:major facilitator superfamily domain-containing protein [Tricladium varicosporioides]|nr:major facilitator superfamily domain-containing protein [Hymenoscyphus varicosporioides]